MSMQAAEKAISEVAPNFIQDQDEDWMEYLPENKNVFMKIKRQKYFAAIDYLDKLKSTFERDNKRENWDDATRKAQTQVYKQTKAAAEKNIHVMLMSLIPKFRIFKREAEEARMALFKRPRIEPNEDEVLIEIDTGPDFGVDKYLPRMNFDETQTSTSKPMKKSPSPSKKSNQSSGTVPEPSKPVETTRVDPLIIDTDPKDAEILLKFKPLVNKYDCRDKVLSLMRIYRKQNANKKALECFYKYFDLPRS